MNITITPSPLSGTVQIPSSKSMTHRELICAGLTAGESLVDNVSLSNDITATISCMEALSARFEEVPSAFEGRHAYRVTGGVSPQGRPITLDAGESGSTLRFLIPIAVYSGNTVTFEGHGRLVERPLTPYYMLFDEKGIHYETAGTLPVTVSGTFPRGGYRLPGNVSSQFFTGLLFVLPLLHGDSFLESTTPLESESYVDMTLECMARHGISIDRRGSGEYYIYGNQSYKTGQFAVEGDYSQAAFWLAAGLLGKGITATGLSLHSTQGDRVITDILTRMGGVLTRDGNTLAAHPSGVRGTVIDAEDCPDLVPVLAALAAVSEGKTDIIHAARVRLKECDRLHAMAVELTKLGAHISEKPDGLTIEGVPALTGGTVDAWNDHRIAMALAAVSSKCTSPLTITGAECVKKSYPGFWKDFGALKGKADG